MRYKFETKIIKSLSDTHTPVELYLKLRDRYPNSFLLESSDHKSKQNSFSYLCFDPIAAFTCQRNRTILSYPDKSKVVINTPSIDIKKTLFQFTKDFDLQPSNFEFTTGGFFGYTSYDAIPLLEDIKFNNSDFGLPLMQYHFFRFIIIFNHFNNELFLVEHLLDGEESTVDQIQDLISIRAISKFPFSVKGNEVSNYSDEDFLELIKLGKMNCQRGDVFQLVLSRKFKQPFLGDEFNVYRALRSINPSPYLFYFDYGNFKIFGSSPEAQLTISHNKAIVNPIAGTFNRTGIVKEDNELAMALLNDPKENSEHVMLVDLARNDLSKDSREVKVESYKEVEYYSHVIHLVSKVSAELSNGYNPIGIFSNTFPAGTLSGAPKHRAMQLIDQYENESRGHYGGSIGILGLDGSVNHAIFIRSFISEKNTLTYQAGCGIVVKSEEEKELQEVNNKLSALRKAIELAKEI